LPPTPNQKKEAWPVGRGEGSKTNSASRKPNASRKSAPPEEEPRKITKAKEKKNEKRPTREKSNFGRKTKKKKRTWGESAERVSEKIHQNFQRKN